MAPGRGRVTRVGFESAADLERALGQAAPGADAVVMAAAVADFRPRDARPGQALPPRRRRRWPSTSTAVPDLLAGIGRVRRDGRPFLVGFAAEVAGGARAGRSGPAPSCARKVATPSWPTT